MNELDELVNRLERLVSEVEEFDPDTGARVFELLDGIDAIHRMALDRLAEHLGPDQVEVLRKADGAVRWLFDAYAIGVDQASAAEEALDSIRPFIESHGGAVHVLSTEGGRVRVKLSGACSGCSASAVTLQHGVEEALRDNLPWFAGMDVEDEDAAPHAPPGPTLLQIVPLTRRET